MTDRNKNERKETVNNNKRISIFRIILYTQPGSCSRVAEKCLLISIVPSSVNSTIESTLIIQTTKVEQKKRYLCPLLSLTPQPCSFFCIQDWSTLRRPSRTVISKQWSLKLLHPACTKSIWAEGETEGKRGEQRRRRQMEERIPYDCQSSRTRTISVCWSMFVQVHWSTIKHEMAMGRDIEYGYAEISYNKTILVNMRLHSSRTCVRLSRVIQGWFNLL